MKDADAAGEAEEKSRHRARNAAGTLRYEVVGGKKARRHGHGQCRR